MASGSSTSQELVVYKSLYNYSPSSEDEEEGYIEIREDDLLEVVAPTLQEEFRGTLHKPQGWMKGKNRRSGKVGLFPGTYVEYERTERLPVRPPHQKKPPTLPRSNSRAQETRRPSDNNDSGYMGSPSGSMI